MPGVDPSPYRAGLHCYDVASISIVLLQYAHYIPSGPVAVRETVSEFKSFWICHIFRDKAGKAVAVSCNHSSVRGGGKSERQLLRLDRWRSPAVCVWVSSDDSADTQTQTW